MVAIDPSDLLLRLCMDDSPVVRRHTMMYIGKVAAGTQEEVVKEFMGVFTSIAGDEQIVFEYR